MDRAELLLTALAHVAWADGVLLPAEAQFFLSVLRGLELPSTRQARFMANLLHPPALTALPWEIVDKKDCHWLLGMGYQMAAADGHVSPAETDALAAIAQAAGISWAEAEVEFSRLTGLVAPAAEPS